MLEKSTQLSVILILLLIITDWISAVGSDILLKTKIYANFNPLKPKEFL